MSGFRTINLIAFLLLAGYGILSSRGNQLDYKKEVRPITITPYLYAFFSTVLITIISVIYSFKGSIDEDVTFYVNVAEELGTMGHENIFHYFNQYENWGNMPYHYFELWLGSLLFKTNILSVSNGIIFRYGCYAILKTLAVLGLLGLVETIKKIKPIDILFAVLFLLFNSLYITELFNSPWALQTSMWLRPNLIPYYVFLFPFFMLLWYKNYSGSLLIILLMSIMVGPTAPAVYSAASALLILLVLANRKNKEQRTRYLIWFSIVICTAVMVSLFYKITGSDKTVWNPTASSSKDILKHTLHIWKAIVFMIVTLPIRAMSMFLIPILSILIVFRKSSWAIIKRNSLLIVFTLLLTVSAIVIFQLATFMDNTYQLPYVGYSACYILSVYLFYHVISEASNKGKMVLVASITLIYIIINLNFIKTDFDLDVKAANLADLNLKRKNLSDEYVAELNTFFKGKKDLTGGFIHGMDNRINSGESDTDNPHSTGRLGSYIYYIHSDIKLLPFTDPVKLYEGQDEHSFFFRRYKILTNVLPFFKDPSNSYDQLLKKYLPENKVSFIIADRYFNLDYLKDVCVKKHITDKNTGHQFIELCSE
ncbi:MAG: hypothetical protein ACXVPN_07665 [Bacteroidia bacterium]